MAKKRRETNGISGIREIKGPFGQAGYYEPNVFCSRKKNEDGKEEICGGRIFVPKNAKEPPFCIKCQQNYCSSNFKVNFRAKESHFAQSADKAVASAI